MERLRELLGERMDADLRAAGLDPGTYERYLGMTAEERASLDEPWVAECRRFEVQGVLRAVAAMRPLLEEMAPSPLLPGSVAGLGPVAETVKQLCSTALEHPTLPPLLGFPLPAVAHEVTVEWPTVVWLCDTCHVAIADGEGALCVDYRDIDRYTEDLKQARSQDVDSGATKTFQTLGYADLSALPQPPRWSVEHEACATPVGYVIPVEQLRTPAQLAHWTAHLWEKDWFRHTRWDAIARHAERHFSYAAS